MCWFHLAQCVAAPKPAEAACAIINPSPTGPSDLGFYQVVCGGSIPYQVSYDDGVAPTDAGDTTFDADIHLTTIAPVVPGTFINSPWDGIDINSTNTPNPYNVEVYVDNDTAIWAKTEVVQVRTSESGTIGIENHGFLSNSEGGFGQQDGIQAQSDSGNIRIDNYGMVGVVFIPGLDFSGGNFIDTNEGGATVYLTDGSAFNIPTDAANGITGNGISAVSESGTIEVNNLGTVWAARDGIYAETPNAITIRNLSTSSIHSGLDGIGAFGLGGDINIFNGDGTGNTPPIPDNADGVIEAGQNGIYATNSNGGNISIWNGFQSPSNSKIIANGDYGIYGNSSGSGSTSHLNIYNYGLAQVQGASSDSVVWGEASSSESGSYAAFYNGSTGVAELTNYNARLNGYGFDDNTLGGGSPTVDGSDPFGIVDTYDANGIELRKLGGTGGMSVSESYDAWGGEIYGSAGTYGVIAKNYGMWDFGGTDNYLTPGFSSENTPVSEGYGANTTGGVYAPGGSAVLIRNYSDSMTGVWNWGTMIGQGSRYDPVLDIKTSESESGAGTFLYNGEYGLIGSAATPYNWGQYGLFDGVEDLIYALQSPG